MNAAEKHVAALVAAFGSPPFELVAFGVRCVDLEAVDNTVCASIEFPGGAIMPWRVVEPEALVLDAAGPIVRTYPAFNDSGEPVLDPVTGEQGTNALRFREDPLAVASAELASFIKAVA